MDRPTFVIAASVAKGNRLQGFFRSGSGSPKELLAHPPTFRWAGFDLTTGDEPHLVGDDAYQVQSGDRKVIRVYQDGTLIFRAAADWEFLGWGQEPEQFAKTPRLNPVAVVEANTAFVHLYAALVPFLVKPSSTVHFKLAIRNGRVGDKRISLTQYYERGIQYVIRPTLFPVHSIDAEEGLELPLQDLSESPNEVAFRVVTCFYELFDMDFDLIPFVKKDEDHAAIDIEAIKRL